MTREQRVQGDAGSPPEPPAAPSVRRRLSIYRWQALGMMVIAAIPILAVTGVLGERSRAVRARVGSVNVSGSVPSIMRYGMSSAISVHVHNTSSTTLEGVRVHMDTAYLARFVIHAATPPFTDAFMTSLSALRAGESALLTVSLQARQYGRHRGSVVILARDDSLRLDFTTVVFP